VEAFCFFQFDGKSEVTDCRETGVLPFSCGTEGTKSKVGLNRRSHTVKTSPERRIDKEII
jgi:hypothetical protein